MLKSYLVTVDGSEYSAAAVGYAIAIAKRAAARITLLSVVDIVSLEGPFLADLLDRRVVPTWICRQVREPWSESEADPRDTPRRCARPASTARPVETDAVSRVICDRATYAPSSSAGRRAWDRFRWARRSEVRGCSKPVLVTPRQERPLTRLLVAYDGSRTANRALGLAATLAAGLDLPLVAVCVSSDEREGLRSLRGRIH
jgi:nucleotide-binding universal stress UspA family protein